MTEGYGLPAHAAGMRIGLFGGSFNPAHEGHKLVATQCLKRLGLDRLWVMVTPGNPLKDATALGALEERLSAARQLMDHPRIDVTGFEAEHGFRYTYETLEFLRETAQDTQFVWIMGADGLRDFDRWERWEEIARMIPIAVYARPGTNFRATLSKAATRLRAYRIPEEEAATLAGRTPPAWVYLRGVMSAQSSTAIRAGRSHPQVAKM